VIGEPSTHLRAWNDSHPPRHWARTFILTLAATATLPFAASAEPLEARTYLDIGMSWPLAPDRELALRLGPFVRQESRFREAGLIYAKALAGARMSLLPWLRAAAYYARTDFPGSNRQQAHMAVLDVFVDFHIGPLVMFDKNGFEGHLTDDFFRYRNAFELRWDTPLGWLAPFSREELRVDSDAERVNLLDAWAGLLFRLPNRAPSPLSLRLFYGYEANRRGRSEWAGVHLFGIEIAARI
jgi:hypothetical protein